MKSILVVTGLQFTVISYTFNLIEVNLWSLSFCSIISSGIVTTPKSLIIKDMNYSISQSINRRNGY
jgi:hypothetical protein